MKLLTKTKPNDSIAALVARMTDPKILERRAELKRSRDRAARERTTWRNAAVLDRRPQMMAELAEKQKAANAAQRAYQSAIDEDLQAADAAAIEISQMIAAMADEAGRLTAAMRSFQSFQPHPTWQRAWPECDVAARALSALARLLGAPRR